MAGRRRLGQLLAALSPTGAAEASSAAAVDHVDEPERLLESRVASFGRDGFVVLRGFLDREQLAEARREADASISAVRTKQGGKFVGVVKALENDSQYFEEQLLRGPHVSLMERLVGDALAPASAGYFDKLQGGKDVPIAPHADSGGQRNGATLWIALDRADMSNGCISYLRGSHRRASAIADTMAKLKSDAKDGKGSNPFALDAAFEESLDAEQVFRFVGRAVDIVATVTDTDHVRADSRLIFQHRCALTASGVCWCACSGAWRRDCSL